MRRYLLILGLLLGLSVLSIWSHDPASASGFWGADRPKKESSSYAYYYRRHNNCLQKRLYNRTEDAWAEPDWQDVRTLP